MLSILALILGLIVGSFINAWVWRVKFGYSVWRGRSMCPACRKPLTPFELVPVLSFIALKGRCSSCQAKISWQYPLVELASAILFVLAFSLYGTSLVFLVYLLFVISILLAIFVFDLKYYLIPDQFTLPAILIVILFDLVLKRDLISVVIGAGVGLLFFAIQFVVSRGAWIGGGDLRLGLLMGLILGWPMILLALFISYITGALVGITLLLKKTKDWKSQLPFGPFLTGSTIFCLFWGDWVLKKYLTVLGY